MPCAPKIFAINRTQEEFIYSALNKCVLLAEKIDPPLAVVAMSVRRGTKMRVSRHAITKLSEI